MAVKSETGPPSSTTIVAGEATGLGAGGGTRVGAHRQQAGVVSVHDDVDVVLLKQLRHEALRDFVGRVRDHLVHPLDRLHHGQPDRKKVSRDVSKTPTAKAAVCGGGGWWTVATAGNVARTGEEPGQRRTRR